MAGKRPSGGARSSRTTTAPPGADGPRENDVVVSLRDPAYKAALFARFRALHRRRDAGGAMRSSSVAARRLLLTFRRGRGRFFRLKRGGKGAEEVGEEEAFESECARTRGPLARSAPPFPCPIEFPSGGDEPSASRW